MGALQSRQTASKGFFSLFSLMRPHVTSGV